MHHFLEKGRKIQFVSLLDFQTPNVHGPKGPLAVLPQHSGKMYPKTRTAIGWFCSCSQDKQRALIRRGASAQVAEPETLCEGLECPQTRAEDYARN